MRQQLLVLRNANLSDRETRAAAGAAVGAPAEFAALMRDLEGEIGALHAAQVSRAPSREAPQRSGSRGSGGLCCIGGRAGSGVAAWDARLSEGWRGRS